jgi:hypothetical protein
LRHGCLGPYAHATAVLSKDISSVMVHKEVFDSEMLNAETERRPALHNSALKN